MEVTEALVRHVARLARLALSDEEVAAMVPRLGRILHHVEAITAVDVGRGATTEGATTEGAAGEATGEGPTVGSTSLRPDLPAPCLDRRAALANAPAHDQVFFLVPRVLGED